MRGHYVGRVCFAVWGLSLIAVPEAWSQAPATRNAPCVVAAPATAATTVQAASNLTSKASSEASAAETEVRLSPIQADLLKLYQRKVLLMSDDQLHDELIASTKLVAELEAEVELEKLKQKLKELADKYPQTPAGRKAGQMRNYKPAPKVPPTPVGVSATPEPSPQPEPFTAPPN